MGEPVNALAPRHPGFGHHALAAGVPPRTSRAAAASAIVALHVAAFAALWISPHRTAIATSAPVLVLMQLGAPTSAPPKPLPHAPAPKTATRTEAPAPEVTVPPSDSSTAPPEAVPAPVASIGTERTAPSPLITAPVAERPTPPPLVLPDANAAYLANPPPEYPKASRRMGEQGRVILRVLIGTDGKAHRAEVRVSSGYERLDEAALKAVLAWKYEPGRRHGVPESMWFDVPVQFVLG
jgi:protein TonB